MRAEIIPHNAEYRAGENHRRAEEPFASPGQRFGLYFVPFQDLIANVAPRDYSSCMTRTEKSVNFALLQVYITFLTMA